ncbi:TetR/AcrR family transcriptional regulator [Clostridium sp. AM45-5]|nr:TetR/AcrR family transcriptional regulator [Clostridium sp. AM45-5]RHS64340.1 TetR/AcrR family transcriptional regulator [Clostridium sp. AM45-5]
MKGKGLTMEVIVAAATELVEEKGYNNFSVRELAQKLHVKAASLYNHLNTIDDVNKEIGLKAVSHMNEYLEQSAEGKEKDEALRALATRSAAM